MRNTKRGKRYLVLFLVFSLVITTCIANSSVPNSQAKKKKQTITILNKKKKGVLTIQAGKKVQLKVKVNGKKVPQKKMKKILKFKSSNKKVLLVSKKGQLFAKKAGKTTVTVTQKKGKKMKTRLKVKVLPKNTSQNQTKLPTETAMPTATADTTPIVTVKPIVTITATVTPTVKPTATASTTPTVSAKPTATATAAPQLVSNGECSTMTHGGQYAGPSDKLGFSAMAFYVNGDYCSTSYTFTGTNKKYLMVVKGVFDKSSTAGISVYIGGKKVGAVSFT